MTLSLLLRTAAAALLASVSALPAFSQDDPVYFLQNFEDKTNYPSSRTATEQRFDAPYGEWIYVNASSSTSSSYLRTGMGLCQGQTCGRLVKGIIAKELGVSPMELESATARAPMRPVEMEILANEKGGGEA